MSCRGRSGTHVATPGALRGDGALTGETGEFLGHCGLVLFDISPGRRRLPPTLGQPDGRDEDDHAGQIDPEPVLPLVGSLGRALLEILEGGFVALYVAQLRRIRRHELIELGLVLGQLEKAGGAERFHRGGDVGRRGVGPYCRCRGRILGQDGQQWAMRCGKGQGLGVLRHEVRNGLPVDDGVGHRKVVHDRVDGGDHERQEDEGNPDNEAQRPAPEGETGCDQSRVLLFDALGVTGDPRGEDEGRPQRNKHRFEGEGVVAGVGMSGVTQEDDEHDDRERGTDDHEGLAHFEPVRQQTDHNQGDDIGSPEPRIEPVGLRHREVGAVGVLEDDRIVDGEEAGRGVVEEKEHRDTEGRADEVPLEYLTPWMLGRLEQLVFGQTTCARLNERLVARRHHQLVPQLGGEIPQGKEGDHKDHDGGEAGDDELALPVGLTEVIQRVQGDERRDQASRHRPHRPKPHGGGATELGAEVAHQRRRGDQDGAFDDTDKAGEDQVGPLVVRQGNADRGEQPDDEQPIDDHVGPTETIGLAGRQGGKRAEKVGDHDDRDVEREVHVEAGQNVGRHSGLCVVRVVEDDGGENGQREVPGAPRSLRILIDRMVEEELAHRAPNGRLSRRNNVPRSRWTHTTHPHLRTCPGGNSTFGGTLSRRDAEKRYGASRPHHPPDRAPFAARGGPLSGSLTHACL